MDASTEPKPPRRRARALLLRGESLIASLGLATAAILVCTLAAIAWVSARNQRTTGSAARREHVQAVAGFVGQSAESMLAADELSTLRRLVVEVRRTSELAACRILLPDGRVIADGDPSKITLVSLPKKWSAAPLDVKEPSADDSVININRALLVPGRGPAALQILAKADAGGASPWEMSAGPGVIAAGGMLALLLVYRQMRRRVATLGMIRDALLALSAGERSREALTVVGDGGPEAQAWNALLEQAESLRRQSVAGHARELFDRRRESRGEMELACDSLAVGLILLDDRGCIRQANGAAAALLRKAREELPGAELATFFDEQVVKASIAETVGGGATQRRTHEIQRTDQEQNSSVLRVHIRPLRREDSSAVLVTIEDITQQRVAEEARHSFVTQATHELRTPLTNMRLCLETAIEHEQKDPKVQAQCLNILNQETRRLERTVTEILSVSEIEAGSLKIHRDDLRLDALFEGLKTDVQALAKDKKLTLSFELPPKLPVIQADRDKFVLALHNLIGNAIKYTPEGGKVTVTVRVTAQQVAIDVTDTGIGIKPEEHQLIFERFYRAKDPRVAKITGSGLGLALTRDVARLHGGDVTVFSEIDAGSTFTLTVPVVSQAA
jgi:PAS domain S-box-containing protein